MKRGLLCSCSLLLCTALVAGAAGPGALKSAGPSRQLELQTVPANYTGDSAAIVGTRITTVCPADAIFSQPAMDSGTAGNSDVDGGYKVYDNYSTYNPIEDIHFWGISAYYNNGWFQCTPNAAGETFLIEFWNDDGSGAPDTTAPVCTYNLTIVPTPDGTWGSWNAYYYTADLVPACVLPSGWVSVQGTSAGDSCWFLWINAAYDDGAYQSGAPTTYDVGFCLTGQFVERFGACCDELTGNCVDNVAEINCLGPNQRFVADTLCANLDPPCAPPPVAACCIDGICIADFTEAECLASAGTWFEGESCFASPPFECPGPPACPTENLLFAQEPQSASGGDWDAWDSDTGWPSIMYENFAGVAGEICDVHWFGFGYNYVDATDCPEGNLNFNILFYPDDGAGFPDVANPVCIYQDILANRVETEIYDSTVGLLQGYAWDVVLSPCCTMIEGWISIQGIDGDNCLFHWLSSPAGLNSESYYDQGNGFEPTGKDRSLCLTGGYIEVRGACCDDATGVCTDDVLLENCTGPYVRFAQDTLCADLVPPCGLGEGACCYPDGTCEITTYDGCIGGEWLGAGSTCNDCPCILFCLPCMTPEGEPICSDGYIDSYNGGCNSTPAVFQPITVCDTVICGTTGTFDGGTRDTDWYEITVSGPGTLYWTMIAGWEGPDGLVFILEPGPNGCSDYIQHTNASSPGCLLTQASHEVPIGEHTYWLWAGPADYTGVPCGAIYYAWADFECAVGACCFPDDSCALLSWGECCASDGEWNGAPSCDPNPCAGCPNTVNRGNSDCSADNAVNAYDIDYFIAAVAGEAQWNALHGGAPPCNYYCGNDMNCDGAVNSYDIDRFIQAVSAGVELPCP